MSEYWEEYMSNKQNLYFSIYKILKKKAYSKIIIA